MVNPEYEIKPSKAFDSFLRKYTGICAEVVKNLVGQTPEQKPFFHAAYFASLEASPEDPDGHKAQLRKLGIDGDILINDLNALLEEDNHLKECCGNAVALAYYLDDFIEHLAWLADLDIEASKFESYYNNQLSELKARTYECRFTRVALSHLYNFDSNVIKAEIGTFRVERLESNKISALLGESTPVSFLNPEGVGNFFIVSEEVGSCPDVSKWIIAAHQQAEDLVTVLKYFKDGIVYVDYSIPHYKPEWVNQLWKRGIHFIGKPHLFRYRNGEHYYHLDETELESLKNWFHVYKLPEVASLLDDHRNKVRQSIIRAADYYQDSDARPNAVAKLPDLAIALESLFAPSDKAEFSFRIAQSIAQIVGRTAEERKQIYKMVRVLYDKRSTLLHGAYNVDDYYEGRFVTDDDIETWSSLIRKAILHTLTLYLNGWNNRDNLLKAIIDSTLDNEIAERLRNDGDFNAFISSKV